MSHQQSIDQKDLKRFNNAVTHLHAGWTLWRRLFQPDESHYFGKLTRWHADCEEARRVRTNASPFVFDQIAWLTLQSIVLGVCRLCDPQETGGKENLTVSWMTRHMPETEPSESKTEEDSAPSMGLALTCVRRLKSDKHLVALRKLRNKVIAHHDLASARNPEKVPGVVLAGLHDNIRCLVTLCHALKHLAACAPVSCAAPSYHPSFREEDKWVDEGARIIKLLARGLERNNARG